MTRVAFTILGQAASKANSRSLAEVGPADNRRTLFIKSEAARDFEASAIRQIPPAARVEFKGPVRVTLRIFYRTNLSDLDESIVLDAMQTRYAKASKRSNGTVRPKQLLQRGVYANDRQVREKHVYHGIDKANPRVEIVVEPMGEQAAIEMPEPMFFEGPAPVPEPRRELETPF